MSEQVIKEYIRDNYISKVKIRKTIENYQSQLQLCNKLDARTMISKKGLKKVKRKKKKLKKKKK